MLQMHSSFVLVFLALAGCAARPLATDYPRTPSQALQHTEDTPLGRAIAHGARAHPNESGFHLLPTGTESFLAHIALVEAAQRSIDLQYYSTRDDTTGKLLLQAISHAAARGVRVRMLIDDWNLDDFRAGAVALNALPNIEIRVFNPYSTNDQSLLARAGNFLTRIDQFTRRMHNKSLIVDNQAAIMGGRNLGDEYFDADHTMDFRDMDVLAAGPVVQEMSASFDRYWNSDEAYPLSALNLPDPDPNAITNLRDELHQHWEAVMHSPAGKKLRGEPLPHALLAGHFPLIWAPAEFVADSPEKIHVPTDEAHSRPAAHIDRLVKGAQHEFVLITPYFIPLENGVHWLNALVARGVRVRILTNSLASTDVVPAEAGYSHYRVALLKGGVELYELRSPQPHPVKSMFEASSEEGLHAKVYIIDRRVLVIGSFNMDPRSVHFNTEEVLVIHSPQLSQQIAKLFDEITSPESSYHLALADTVPPAGKPALFTGPIVWISRENGKTVYYDFSPHAGFWRHLTNGLFSLLPLDDQL